MYFQSIQLHFQLSFEILWTSKFFLAVTILYPTAQGLLRCWLSPGSSHPFPTDPLFLEGRVNVPQELILKHKFDLLLPSTLASLFSITGPYLSFSSTSTTLFSVLFTEFSSFHSFHVGITRDSNTEALPRPLHLRMLFENLIYFLLSTVISR